MHASADAQRKSAFSNLPARAPCSRATAARRSSKAPPLARHHFVYKAQALTPSAMNCTPACCSGAENLCLDNIDSSGWGVLFELALLLYAFTAVAIIADDHLVVSLETLCVRWNVREDVAGASFMAFGSAAPEIIINAISTIKTVCNRFRTLEGRRGRLPVPSDVFVVKFSRFSGPCQRKRRAFRDARNVSLWGAVR